MAGGGTTVISRQKQQASQFEKNIKDVTMVGFLHKH